MRAPLRRVLTEVWDEVIATDYANQRVNSERSLQAAVWAGLNKRLPPRTRRLFVEPSFVVGEEETSRRVCPDLVICNSRRVIAIIEVKYEPRRAPSVRKDLRTLQSLAKHGERMSLTNARYLGDAEESKTYQLTEKTIFIWAGVYRGGDSTMQPLAIEVPPILAGRFQSLHAVTQRGESAVTFSL